MTTASAHLVPSRDVRRRVPARGTGRELIRCGAEAVELTERFYQGVFLGIGVFVAVSAAAALVLLPLRAGGGGAPLTGVAGGAIVLMCAPAVLWRPDWVYRLLRRRLAAEFAIVLFAAALVSAVLPLRSQLWWPSCTILMLVAVVAPVPRMLAYCLTVLAINLLAHVIAGDLDKTPAVSIIGLWIGYIFWSLTVGLVTDRLAAHLMQLNSLTPGGRRTVVRVPDYRADHGAESARREPVGGATLEDGLSADGERNAPVPLTAPGRLTRLTGRQLQVVALLADGLRYQEVADCLSISVGQVQRHVSRAVRRLGVENVSELVAVAVNDGLIPTLAENQPMASSDEVNSDGDNSPA